MKKILILSYHFEPMNVIATQRTLGYANHFKKFGFEPTIVTFHWGKTAEERYCEPLELFEKTIFETNEHYSAYKMPIAKYRTGKFLKKLEKTKLNKFGILISWMFGHLDTTGDSLMCKLTERNFLKEHLKTNRYDVAIGVFSPHFHLSNCSWIYKKFKIPYVLDFRDLWDNRIIHSNYKPSFTEKTQDFFTKLWWKKWTKWSLLLSTVSKPLSQAISLITKRECNLVFNGFENSFSNQKKTFERTEFFNIVSTGTVYPDQDLSVIVEGIDLFLKTVDLKTVKIHFIGLEKDNIISKIKTLKAVFPSETLTITKRLPKEEATRYQNNATVLIFPTTPSIPGMLSGKIYEYISTIKPILAAPSDIGAVKELIELTSSGVCLDNPIQIQNFLIEKYNEWMEIGFCKQNTNMEKVNLFSRESQTKNLAELIKNSQSY